MSCDQGIWRVPTLSGRQRSQLECRRTRYGKVAASSESSRTLRRSEDTTGIGPNLFAERDLHVSLYAAALVAIGAGGSAWATLTDVRSRRITNANVATMTLLGLVVRHVDGGWASTVWGLTAVALSGVACVVPYRKAIIGGGDVKLLASLSVLIGPVATIYMLPVATALGAVIALALARHGVTPRGVAAAIPLAPVIGTAAAIGSACAAAV